MKTARPTKRGNRAPDLETLRKDLAGRLPPLIEKAFTDYGTFATIEIPEAAKDFTAHQAACRAALAHIDLLVKLARWAETGEGDTSPLDTAPDIEGLVAKARAALGGVSDDAPDDY